MTEFQGAWLDRPWGRMRVWRAGRGPIVLAVRGLGGSGRYWRGLAERVDGGCTIVAPDLAGFGASDPPDGDIDRSMLLADLGAVVEAHAPGEPLRAVGHSLGGVLAALWTARNVDRVGSLAMASPPFPDGSAMDYRTRADMRPSSGRRVAAQLARAIWPALAWPIGLATGYPTEVVADFGRQSVRARAWTMWALWSDPALEGELDRLAALDASIPVLLDEGGHQFLLRSGFSPLVDWLARDAAAD